MKLRKGLKLSLVGDGYVIYDTQKEVIITLNITSSFLLEMLLNGRNKGEILEEYIRIFEVDRETALRDLEEFINLMRREGLVED